MAKKKPPPVPPPKKVRGGRGQPAAKASKHKHDDHGRSFRRGDYIVTCCTCGSEVAHDFAPGKD